MFRLAGALQWRELDGEWVVRVEPSGSLFQLDALSAALLSLLEAGPAPLSSLSAAVQQAENEVAGLDSQVSPVAFEVASAATSEAVSAALQRLAAQELVLAPRSQPLR